MIISVLHFVAQTEDLFSKNFFLNLSEKSVNVKIINSMLWRAVIRYQGQLQWQLDYGVTSVTSLSGCKNNMIIESSKGALMSSALNASRQLD